MLLPHVCSQICRLLLSLQEGSYSGLTDQTTKQGNQKDNLPLMPLRRCRMQSNGLLYFVSDRILQSLPSRGQSHAIAADSPLKTALSSIMLFLVGRMSSTQG